MDMTIVDAARLNGAGTRHMNTRFRDAEEAWFWTMAALAERRDGSRRSADKIARPCDPDDVIRCLDRLYRQRRIDLLHARILRIWGERQTPPNPRYEGETSDHAIWSEAMERLTYALRVKAVID